MSTKKVFKTKKFKLRDRNKKNFHAGLKTHIEDMTYRDLKKAVIVRGIPFELAAKSDFPALHSWLHKHMDNDISINRLDKYDNWVEESLKLIGRFDNIHPQLRLGYVGEKSDNEGKIIIKKTREIKPKKEKREKTETGLYKGTKKALTYESEKAGLSIEETVTKVLEVFEDASEKSIKIWYKKSKRGG